MIKNSQIWKTWFPEYKDQALKVMDENGSTAKHNIVQVQTVVTKRDVHAWKKKRKNSSHAVSIRNHNGLISLLNSNSECWKKMGLFWRKIISNLEFYSHLKPNSKVKNIYILKVYFPCTLFLKKLLKAILHKRGNKLWNRRTEDTENKKSNTAERGRAPPGWCVRDIPNGHQA